MMQWSDATAALAWPLWLRIIAVSIPIVLNVLAVATIGRVEWRVGRDRLALVENAAKHSEAQNA